MASFQHFSHSEHALRFNHRWESYKCDGCKQVGFGRRYQCNFCNFDLHEFCARSPVTVNCCCHPEHALVFRENQLSHCVCDLCGEDVSGFVYECRKCNFDLHPLCANLPMTLQHPVHPHHMLQLRSHEAEVEGPPAFICDLCGLACTPGRWIYCCRTCDFYLHISCARQPVDPMEQMRSGHFPTATNSSLATSTPQARSRQNNLENVRTVTSNPRARSHQNTLENVSRDVEGVSKFIGMLSILPTSN